MHVCSALLRRNVYVLEIRGELSIVAAWLFIWQICWFALLSVDQLLRSDLWNRFSRLSELFRRRFGVYSSAFYCIALWLNNYFTCLFWSWFLPLHRRLTLLCCFLLTSVKLLFCLFQQSPEVALSLLQVRSGIISQLHDFRGYPLIVIHTFGAEMRVLHLKEYSILLVSDILFNYVNNILRT